MNPFSASSEGLITVEMPFTVTYHNDEFRLSHPDTQIVLNIDMDMVKHEFHLNPEIGM